MSPSLLRRIYRGIIPTLVVWAIVYALIYTGWHA